MQPIDPIINPTIFLDSFEWREPVTTITDMFVSIASIYAFIRFLRYKGEKSANYNYYKYYFLCFAIGMMSAAWFGHGLQAYVGPEFKRIGWAFSATGLLSLGFASLMQIRQFLKPGLYRFIQIILFAQYFVFMFLMLHPKWSHFTYAQVGSTVSLVGLTLPMQIYHYIKSKNKGSLILFMTIVYGILPGFVFNNQISIHKWLNYHDISHILMAIFILFAFAGASRLAMKTSRT